MAPHTGRLVPLTVEGADLREFDGDARLRAPECAGACTGQVASGVGIAATLAANVAYGLGHGAVSAWPTVALVGSYELRLGAVLASATRGT